MISFPSSLRKMGIYIIYPAHLRMMDTELVRVHGLDKEWSWSAEIPKLGPRIYRKINTCSHPFLDILLLTLHCLIQTLNLVHLNPNMTSGRKYSQDEGKLYFTTSGLTHVLVFLGKSCPHKMHFLIPSIVCRQACIYLSKQGCGFHTTAACLLLLHLYLHTHSGCTFTQPHSVRVLLFLIVNCCAKLQHMANSKKKKKKKINICSVYSIFTGNPAPSFSSLK